MHNNELIELIQKNPIICAVSNLERIKDALLSPNDIIFMLTGDIMNINEIIEKCRDYDKKVFLHLDLIKGFSREISSLKFIKEYLKPDGIISTKATLLKAAKAEGFFTMQRLFMLDSSSLETAIQSAHEIKPNAIEILPGIIYKVIKKTSENLKIPVIAGGLIETKEEVISSLRAGATSISTTNIKLWNE